MVWGRPAVIPTRHHLSPGPGHLSLSRHLHLHCTVPDHQSTGTLAVKWLPLSMSVLCAPCREVYACPLTDPLQHIHLTPIRPQEPRDETDQSRDPKIPAARLGRSGKGARQCT